MAWLKVCGSQVGQDAFNPLKGSIPARTDPERDLYDDYLKYSIDEFATDTIVPSLAHGAAAKPTWSTAIVSAVETFVQDRDVEAFHAALVTACSDADVCL